MAGKPSLSIEHFRQFPNGHAVPDRNRVKTHEAGLRRIEHIALNTNAVDGIGPIQQNKAFAVFGRGFHRQRHSRNIRVKPGADVLDVEDKNIKIPQHLGSRFPRLPIQAANRQIINRIDLVINPVARLLFAPQTMFRAEKGHDSHAGHPPEYIYDEPSITIVRRMVGDDTKALAFKHTLILTHAVQSGLYRAVTTGQHHERTQDSSQFWKLHLFNPYPPLFSA